MIVLWMLYVLGTSGLIALAARSVEEALRSGDRATRWVWGSSLIASAVLPIATIATGGRWTGRLPWFGASDAAVLAGTLEPQMIDHGAIGGSVASSWWQMAAGIDGMLMVAWSLISLAAAVAYVVTWRRVCVARRGCRSCVVDGEPVLVSQKWGPAAVGIRRPVVVIPEWVLAESDEVRRLVLLHEREHVRAGDHALLALSPLVAILMPWNIVSWWQLSRLRVSIEVDCDRRVLRRGVEAARYGSLLIEVAGRTREGVLVPAMAASRTTLERRIVAMTKDATRSNGLHGALCAFGGIACLVLACDAPSPAEFDDGAADAVSSPMPGFDGARFELDGRPVSVEEIQALPRESIHSVEVFKRVESGAARVHSGLVRVTTHTFAVENGLTRQPTGTLMPGATLRAVELPIDASYEIDGRPADRAAALALTPDRIERVEVIQRTEVGAGQDRAIGIVRMITK